MDNVLNYFKKIKLNLKFDKAGEGHSLVSSSDSRAMGNDQSKAKDRTDRSQQSTSTTPRHTAPLSSRGTPQAAVQPHGAQSQRDSQPDDARQRAAAAALSRFSNVQGQQQRSAQVGTFRFADSSQRSAPVTGEPQVSEPATAYSSSSSKLSKNAQSVSSSSAITQVYYCCPALDLPRMPRFELEDQIRGYLYEMIANEPLIASVLILKTCNRFNKAIESERVERAVQLITRYVNNLIEHPTEAKYRQIRADNRVFRESVLAIEGSVQFLKSVGFVSKRLPKVDAPAAQAKADDSTAREAQTETTSGQPETTVAGNETASASEDFFVFDGELDTARIEQLKQACELLVETGPIETQLDRDLRVLNTAESGSSRELHVQFPAEFFSLSKEDLQVAQRELEQTSSDAASLRLRGKAAQERQDAAHKTRLRQSYPFTLIRVRFPNDVLVQGVFESGEPLDNVLEWLASLLIVDWCPYELRNPVLNIAFSSDTLDETVRRKSLLQLEVAPTVLMNFSWSKVLLEDIGKQLASTGEQQRDPNNLLVVLNRFLKPEYLAVVSRN